MARENPSWAQERIAKPISVAGARRVPPARSSRSEFPLLPCGRSTGLGQVASISNTVIADNHASVSVDCEGPITSHDYNFIGDPSGCNLSNKTAHNLNGDPMPGPLQNNGGATDTQALLPGSPALGAGSPEPRTGRAAPARQWTKSALGVAKATAISVRINSQTKRFRPRNPSQRRNFNRTEDELVLRGLWWNLTRKISNSRAPFLT